MRDLNIFEAIFGVVKHYWDIYSSRWGKTTIVGIDEVEILPWSLCKYCHTFIRKLIAGNQNVIDSLLDLGTIDLMLEQISTGWNPPISEIFLSTRKRTDQTLLKKDIRSLVDQISDARANGEYRKEIIDFLASV